jgi:hypothetical protein
VGQFFQHQGLQILADPGRQVLQEPVAQTPGFHLPGPPDSPVSADQLVRLSTYYSRRHYPETLRLVHYRDPDGKDYVFLTNLSDLPALTVADL